MGSEGRIVEALGGLRPGDDHQRRMLRIALLLAIGAAGGLLTGLMGIGGGILLVPAMVLLLGFNQHKAHGTSLAVILPKVLAGVVPYWLARQVDVGISAELAVGGVIGAIAGAKLANTMPGSRLRKLFGLLLLFVAVGMVYDGLASAVHAGGTAPSLAKPLTDGAVALVVTLAVGLFAGALSGLLGVGGGFIMVPAMVYLLHLDQKLAQGISLLVIFPIALSGSAIHFTKGNVDIRDGKWIALGGIAGGVFGGHLACQCSSDVLRLLFGILMLGTAWLTLRKR